jgi:hypothetical protein
MNDEMPTGAGPTGDIPTGGTPPGGVPPGGPDDGSTSQAPDESAATVREVTAREGDTLCTIAVAHGFRDCEKVRAANPEYQDRPVEPGETVRVPEVTRKQESGNTELRHEFERPGLPRRRIWIIQDHNRPTPREAVSDEQRELAVSNFVPTRQGPNFTNGDWVDETVTAHNADASTDPDHFKILVHDPRAKERGESSVQVTLKTQKPNVNDQNQITDWQDMTDNGTTLDPVECRQVDDTEYYKSCYLRLVVDEQDRTAARPHGRTSPTADSGADVSRQVLVTPVPDEQRLEILDLRTLADRPSPECPITNEAARCRTRTLANVGKSEKVLRIRVFRIGGAAGSECPDANVQEMIFTNYRKVLAQANIGVELVDDRIYDVAVPNNMIAVSDFDGVKASGGGTMRVRVRLTGGDVDVSLETTRKHTPQQTANRLAAALRARGVQCRISSNPPVQSSSNDFGSCDILCFNADGSPARIMSRSSSDSAQKLASSGRWNNASVRNAGTQYGAARATDAQIVGSIDYRAAAKNYNTGRDHLAVILVKGFTSATLLGEALLPYRNCAARIRPVREFSMCVFLDKDGVTRETVLTHEAGHVLLDAFHTSVYNRTANVERGIGGETYDNNNRLAFSEWMAAINREPDFIHRRMSDDPLTVEYYVVRRGVRNLQAVREIMGGANPSPVERFRSLSAFVLGNLRTLSPAPGTNL